MQTVLRCHNSSIWSDRRRQGPLHLFCVRESGCSQQRSLLAPIRCAIFLSGR
jgi:hypothetical protein